MAGPATLVALNRAAFLTASRGVVDLVAADRRFLTFGAARSCAQSRPAAVRC
eukprot:gene40741-19488_t